MTQMLAMEYHLLQVQLTQATTTGAYNKQVTLPVTDVEGLTIIQQTAQQAAVITAL
jgi:hypothetical protein